MNDFFYWLILFLIGVNAISLGFVAIFIHIQYFKFEKSRRIQVKEEQLIFSRNNTTVLYLSKKDILSINVYDKRTVDIPSFFPTFIDNYAYAVIKLENQKFIIITSLMSSFLMNNLVEWSGLEVKHHRQFFPFIKKEFLNNALQPQ